MLGEEMSVVNNSNSIITPAQATNTIKKWSTTAAESAAQASVHASNALQNGIGSTINGCYKDNTLIEEEGTAAQPAIVDKEATDNCTGSNHSRRNMSSKAMRIAKDQQRRISSEKTPPTSEVVPGVTTTTAKAPPVDNGIKITPKPIMVTSSPEPEDMIRRTQTLDEGASKDYNTPYNVRRSSSTGSNIPQKKITSATNANKTGGDSGSNKNKKPITSSKQKLDKYGFIINMDDQGNLLDMNVKQRVPTTEQYKTLERREKKWNGMMNTWDTYTADIDQQKSSSGDGNKDSSTSNNKIPMIAKPKNMIRNIPTIGRGGSSRSRNKKILIRRLRKGIPDQLRGKVWCLLCNVSQHINIEHIDYYQKLVKASLFTSNNSNHGEKSDEDVMMLPPQIAAAERGLSFRTSASVQYHASRQNSEEGKSENNNQRNYNNTYMSISGGINDNGMNIATATNSMLVGPKSLVRRPSLRPQTVQAAVQDASSFRQTQETIERDIHRTFPRHHLFHEYSPCNSDIDDDEVNDDVDNGILTGISDQNLTSCIGELEIFDHSNINAIPTATERSSSSQQKQKFAEAVTQDTISAVPTTTSTSSMASNHDNTDQGSNKFDATTSPVGQASLRRVLRAYSLHDVDVGYCQGMNFIAAMFLTFVEEEEAFWILVAAMNDQPCRMRGMFGRDMKATHKVLHVAEKLTHQFLPRLAKHLDKEHIHITMYATQWLLTLFTSSFKFDLVTRVWDCFLAEGWKIVYRVMLALLSYSSPTLMTLSFEDILAYFRDLPDKVIGDDIMNIALKIPLKTKHIIKYENEWLLTQKKQSQEQRG